MGYLWKSQQHPEPASFLNRVALLEADVLCAGHDGDEILIDCATRVWRQSRMKVWTKTSTRNVTQIQDQIQDQIDMIGSMNPVVGQALQLFRTRPRLPKQWSFCCLMMCFSKRRHPLTYVSRSCCIITFVLARCARECHPGSHPIGEGDAIPFHIDRKAGKRSLAQHVKLHLGPR